MLVETTTTASTSLGTLPAGPRPAWGYGISWSRPIRRERGTLFGSVALVEPVWLDKTDFEALREVKP